jgi:hypothetical protein
MTDTPINLIKGDKVGVETDYRDYLPVNMSGIVRPMFGSHGYMKQEPGLTQYGTAVGIDRGGVWNARFESLYRVSGNSFIEVFADGTIDVLGTISGTDTVSLPYSFNTQAIIADGKYFLYDPVNLFREVIDSDLGNPIDAVWINGYYFMTDGEFIFHTELTDEESIDPLQFATAEFMPDPSLGLYKTTDNKIGVLGRNSIEYFIDTASTEFAFTRVDRRALKIGIVGTHTKVEMLDKLFLMGSRERENVSIHTVTVGTVDNIASREVDKLIGKYTDEQLSTSVLESRVEDDYYYLIVHLPDETLLYNVKIAAAAGNENAWSILKTDVLGDAEWRAKHGVFDRRKGVWVYGDKSDNTMGILDETVATHYDEIAEWVLNTPLMYLDSQSVDKVEIEIIPGHTVTSDATVFISLTYDGLSHGQEFSMNYGLPGEFRNRFIQHRFGYIRDWVGFKLRGATRSRMAFSRAYIQHG